MILVQHILQDKKKIMTSAACEAVVQDGCFTNSGVATDNITGDGNITATHQVWRLILGV